MSCMTPAADGTYISIADDEAKEFRQSVIEWLMTNHPHDCPVCEEGGHCHLQDMTVMTGHAARRYRFTKRTHRNQDLGPFINHEMNRCIACYRCVRYYKDYAGGTTWAYMGSRPTCTSGAIRMACCRASFPATWSRCVPPECFTDKTPRHTLQPQVGYAVCAQPSARGAPWVAISRRASVMGELRRIENRYNGSVNHYFLCDRGRFGYGYVNRKDRPRQPLALRDGRLTAVDSGEALARAANLLESAKGVIGIGSPRASLEANFALRALVGAENFHDGHAGGEHMLVQRALQILRTGPLPAATLRGIESADAVLVLGEDVTNTAPRVALAFASCRAWQAAALAAEKHIGDWQAAAVADIGQHEKNPVFVASGAATRLDDIAAATFRAAADDLARLGFAVAHALDSAAPAVEGLDEATARLAQTIANALGGAARPLLVSGTAPAPPPFWMPRPISRGRFMRTEVRGNLSCGTGGQQRRPRVAAGGRWR